MVFVVTFLVLITAIAMIAIRIIVLPGGEFHGTCSTNNEFLRRESDGNCPVCGKTADEPCPNEGQELNSK